MTDNERPDDEPVTVDTIEDVQEFNTADEEAVERRRIEDAASADAERPDGRGGRLRAMSVRHWYVMPNGRRILETRARFERLLMLHQARCVASADGADIPEPLPIVINGRLHFSEDLPAVDHAGVPFVHWVDAGKPPKGPRGPRSVPVTFTLGDLARAWHELAGDDVRDTTDDRYRDDLAVSLNCEPRQIDKWFDRSELVAFRESGIVSWDLCRAFGLPGASRIP